MRDCLRQLRTTDDVHKERTLATEMYLEICADYIDVFLFPRDDLRARIVKAVRFPFFLEFGNFGLRMEIMGY